jgi:hypothetical protein
VTRIIHNDPNCKDPYCPCEHMAPVPVHSLDQDQYWTDINGNQLLIAEMEPSHAGNALRMLVRNAWQVELRYSLREMTSGWLPSGSMASDAVDQMFYERAEDPEKWLLSKPQAQALFRRSVEEFD